MTVEQLELFPNFQGLALSIQKRVQLSFLMQIPEQCVDDYLVLEAWHRDTGYDLVAMAKGQLQRRFGFGGPEELVRNLRDRKFRDLIGARTNLSQKKLGEMSEHPRPSELRLSGTKT